MAGGAVLGIFEDEPESKYDPTISFRCPPQVVARLDEIAKERGIKRTRVIVRLLEVGLAAYDAEKAEEAKKKGAKRG